MEYSELLRKIAEPTPDPTWEEWVGPDRYPFFVEGQKAFLAGHVADACPYKHDTDRAHMWRSGWWVEWDAARWSPPSP
jgi:ribosome modulation factor